MFRLTAHRAFLPLRKRCLAGRGLTTIGIRQEDPKRTWERRAPLTPDDIAALTSGKAEVKVEVESCARRCFTDDHYAKAGAEVVSTLTPKVDLVLGIKEPPVHLVHALQQASPGKKRKYMVFSHTHKGQPYNVPLLSAFLDPHKSQTLIDYELLTAPSEGADASLKRVAAFGWYAGAVGAGEALSMTGLALLRRGIASPLLQLSRPYTFPDIEAYKIALRQCGDHIRSSPLSKDAPIVIGLTGAGNVSTGATEMLDAMGVEWIGVDRLADIRNASQIYACQIPPSAYLSRKSGGGYDKAEYRSKPELYQSELTDKIAPYLTTLINGVGWQTGYPRIMSRNDMDGLVNSGSPQKMIAIQDVACDLEGGLEFIDRHTTIDDPFFLGPGEVLISSIDILPTELPKDASTYFSSKILPYVRYLVSSPEPGQIGDTIRRATIVKDGQLEETHKGLMRSVEAYRATTATDLQVGASSRIGRSGNLRRPAKKKVLLLGSGLVAGPAVQVVSARKDVELGIASNNLREAEALAGRYSNVRAFALDVGDSAALSEAVKQADVVVSLLPAPMHVSVAQRCIEHGKHLVTASYVSSEMKALDEAAKERDVLLLGECGLDPGIDSMAAMRILSRVKREGKIVQSFISWCGGLPEPGASNVPFGYKFSWSPEAVLSAAGNDARYKLGGKIRTVSGQNLLKEHFPKVDLWRGLALEGLANRDAIPYAEKYGLGEVDGLTNLFRGTLRYQGFSRLLDSFRQLGMLDTSHVHQATTWADFFLYSLNRTAGYASPLQVTDIVPLVKDVLGDQAKETLEALEWLNILPHPSSPPMPANLTTPLDVLAHILSVKLAYGPDERDSCLLHHAFEIAPANTSVSPPTDSSAGPYALPTQTQRVTASLLHYGTVESSSMSITVGKTLAFAALRVVDGDVRERGVNGPYEREVWEGVLDKLEEEGVRVQEVWS